MNTALIASVSISAKADPKLFKFSNLSFRQIYALIWCWQHKRSIGEIKNILSLSYPTVSNWLRKLKRQALPASQPALEGDIEVDGSYFGRRRFGRQRLVIGAISPKTKQIRLKIIKYRNRTEAESFIQDTVKIGSIVSTDGFKGCNELPLLGYIWQNCNHSIGCFGPANRIENLLERYKKSFTLYVPEI